MSKDKQIDKVTNARSLYTLASKLEAVRLVEVGQSVPTTAKILGIPAQSLGNWVRLSKKGQLQGAGDKPVTAEQMELARLRAELSRVKMERDILKKATAYFTPEVPNQVWTSDITYIATDEGWLYLTGVIDLFSRQVVGWCMSSHMQANTVYKMKSSMSRKGNCWDNAPTESLWGRLKVGRLYGMRFATRRQAMDEVIDWLNFYNHKRLHSTLGYVSPMTFEQRWHAALQQDRKSA